MNIYRTTKGRGKYSPIIIETKVEAICCSQYCRDRGSGVKLIPVPKKQRGPVGRKALN